jgi:hypothetical protein
MKTMGGIFGSFLNFFKNTRTKFFEQKRESHKGYLYPKP